MAIDVKDTASSILVPYRLKKLAVGEVDYMEATLNDFMKTVVFLY